MTPMTWMTPGTDPGAGAGRYAGAEAAGVPGVPRGAPPGDGRDRGPIEGPIEGADGSAAEGSAGGADGGADGGPVRVSDDRPAGGPVEGAAGGPVRRAEGGLDGGLELDLDLDLDRGPDLGADTGRGGAPDDDARRALAALSRLAEPGDEAVGLAVLRHGAAELYSALLRGGALPPELARRDPQAYRVRLDGAPGPDADLDRVHALGGAFVIPGDPGWPRQLDDLGRRRPLGLWIRGSTPPRLAAVRSVAVVGARACTDYGVHVATVLAADLAEAGWAVVSGAAYGIDAAAHRGALAGGGATLAILACGVDVAYPRGHDRLCAAIAESGALLSELPPGSHPTRYRFIERNRVIAALTRGTVVVEAAVRSGALVSARRAAALGRFVMGVPGPVTAPQSAGVHRLLREPGGLLVTSAAEIIEHVGAIGADLAPIPPGPARPGDDLPRELARVLDAVPFHTAVAASTVAREAGAGPAATRRHLDTLLSRGLVEHSPKGWCRRGGA